MEPEQIANTLKSYPGKKLVQPLKVRKAKLRDFLRQPE